MTFIENLEKDKDSKTPEMETDVYPLTHVVLSYDRITSDIRAASEREVPMACVYAGPPIPRKEEKRESFFAKLLRKIKCRKR